MKEFQRAIPQCRACTESDKNAKRESVHLMGILSDEIARIEVLDDDIADEQRAFLEDAVDEIKKQAKIIPFCKDCIKVNIDNRMQ
ncbi:MAG: hypothetical protein LBG88_00060 [Christensenellaceae bacterium]|jgi:hypothetical protein|nr:hypothetical protein [Christensenellaceae bacterium]